jgi:nucleoside-diphosphate-sugar epimerase
MTRVLVTGGSGFIGTNFVAHLRAAGTRVLNLAVKPPPDSAAAADWVETDITDLGAVADAARSFEPTAIVHLAARTDLDGPDLADYAANTVGVRNVVALARELPIGRAIFASSRLVCRIGYEPVSDTDYRPSTVYGQSKVVGEEIVRGAGLTVPWVIVRPTSIWGPWFGEPYRPFFEAVRRGRYVNPAGREIRKSFGFVGNTVHQLAALLTADPSSFDGRTFYLADPEPLELRTWANAIADAFGVKRPRDVPVAPLRAGAKVGDAAKRMGVSGIPLTSFRLDNLLTPMVHDLHPLAEVTGPVPFTLDQGVRVTADWLATQTG